MPDTQTPHYPTWIKPEVGGDATVWGTVLNTTLDAIDAVVFNNQQTSQQAELPIGSLTMWAGATASPPANWLICDGRTLDYGATPAYLALFNVIGRAFNTALTGTQFALPNLVQNFPLGAGTNPVGTTGGSYGVTIATANLPAHAHPITDVTHSHTAYQSGHSHNLIIGSHSHTFAEWSTNSSGIGTAVRADTANYWQTYQTASTSTQALGGNTDTQTPPVGVNPQGTGLSTTQNTGGGAAINVIPPFVALNFIIRYPMNVDAVPPARNSTRRRRQGDEAATLEQLGRNKSDALGGITDDARRRTISV